MCPLIGNVNNTILGEVAYHDYEGIALRNEEKERLVKNLGDRKAMILKNHGLLTCGNSVSHAFWLMHYLIKGCSIQVILSPTIHTTQRNTTQHNTTQRQSLFTHNTIQQLLLTHSLTHYHSLTTQDNTTQHNTLQHNTLQPP